MDNNFWKNKIESLVKKNIDTGCWEWLGKSTPQTKSAGSYPRLFYKGVYISMRKKSFETYIGEIYKRSIHVKNTCKNLMCVNPDHLELAISGGEKLIENKKKQTHCKRGHSLENCLIGTKGERKCRICHRERQAKRMKLKKNKLKAKKYMREYSKTRVRKKP